jgi:hypothetical protein
LKFKHNKVTEIIGATPSSSIHLREIPPYFLPHNGGKRIVKGILIIVTTPLTLSSTHSFLTHTVIANTTSLWIWILIPSRGE